LGNLNYQLKRLYRRLQIRFARRAEGVPNGAIVQPVSPVSIEDGANYSLPIMLPEYLRAQLSKAGKLATYLTEAAATTYRHQFDTPQRGNADLPVPTFTEDPLREWNPQTREMVLSHTHSAEQRNPIANRAVKYTSAFVIGEGFNLVCKNEEVEKVLQAFIDHPDNQIRKYERQAVKDLLVDGEIILRFFKGGESDTDDEMLAGQVVVVPQRPWELVSIKTALGFFRRAVTYNFQRLTTEGDDPTGKQDTVVEPVPAADILMVTINNHGYELRGRPELFAVLPWLRAYKEWLENRARQNHWRGALLWWVKIMSSVPSVIAAKLAQYQRPPTPGSMVRRAVWWSRPTRKNGKRSRTR
jgi:hypothetical protein